MTTPIKSIFIVFLWKQMLAFKFSLLSKQLRKRNRLHLNWHHHFFPPRKFPFFKIFNPPKLWVNCSASLLWFYYPVSTWRCISWSTVALLCFLQANTPAWNRAFSEREISIIEAEIFDFSFVHKLRGFRCRGSPRLVGFFPDEATCSALHTQAYSNNTRTFKACWMLSQTKEKNKTQKVDFESLQRKTKYKIRFLIIRKKCWFSRRPLLSFSSSPPPSSTPFNLSLFSS